MLNKLCKALILFFCILSFSTVLYAQYDKRFLTAKNARSLRLFREALESFSLMDYGDALERLKSILEKDDTFSEAWLLKAECHYETKNYHEAFLAYEQCFTIDSTLFPDIRYNLGKSAYLDADYQKSVKHLSAYLADTVSDSLLRERAGHYLSCAAFADSCLKHPRDISIENMGQVINSGGSEYINALPPGTERIYFTARPPADTSATSDEDFLYAEWQNEQWVNRSEIGEVVNTSGNEGAMFVSHDGKYLFHAACMREDGYGSCDIYVSAYSENGWQKAINLGSAVNSPYWDSQPCFSSDGRHLLFSSNRPGGYGKADLWMSALDDKGNFGKAVNMGPKINTPGDEMAPFLHPDQGSLYFSSNGHIGLGGMDIYMINISDSSDEVKAINLGYPINTKNNEINMINSLSGEDAYLSSDRPGGYGNHDIYHFRIPGDIRPMPLIFVSGFIYDAASLKPLEAECILQNTTSGKEIARSISQKHNGEFLLCLPYAKDISFYVSRPGYLFYSGHFSGDSTSKGKNIKELKIALQALKKDSEMELKNVFFDTDSFRLKEKSYTELKRLLRFLKDYPEICIEISGHTDIRGSSEYNLKLSEKRAQSVFNYLTANGIEGFRMQAIGYGESMAKENAADSTSLQKNRRTSVKIIDCISE